ncbi:MAG: sulfate transporter family protein [Rhizobiaceae bacterium]|nr:sulfate transporter family protein [Rhizobiaceae bacterium]
MVIASARKAVSGLLSARSRMVVLKSLGLTILLFFGLWFLLNNLMTVYVIPFIEGWSWLVGILVWVLGAGVFVAAGFLLAPVTAIFAGLFLDDIAEHVERVRYPDDEPGQGVPFGPAILLALKFGAFVVGANLLALMLVWFAGFGVIIFFLLNGFLLGREYFQFATMRFRSEDDAKGILKKYSLEVFLAGLIIAAFMSVPVLNLFTPVFASALMVHLHKAVSAEAASNA